MKKFYKTKLPLSVVLILTLMLPLVSSSGKIFLSRQAARGRTALDTTAGWQKIYQCPVTINSSRAILSVYGCDEPFEAVATKLKYAFPSENGNMAVQNRNMGWIISHTGNQILRLQALAMPETDKCVIFALAQTPAEFAKSAGAPQQSAIFGPRSFPEGKLNALLKNEETGTTLETMLFNAAPNEVAGRIAEELSGNGWQIIFPSKNRSATDCFFIFKRSSALCAVTIAPALRENKTCVTFLHKEIREEQ